MSGEMALPLCCKIYSKAKSCTLRFIDKFPLCEPSLRAGTQNNLKGEGPSSGAGVSSSLSLGCCDPCIRLLLHAECQHSPIQFWYSDMDITRRLCQQHRIRSWGGGQEGVSQAVHLRRTRVPGYPKRKNTTFDVTCFRILWYRSEGYQSCAKACPIGSYGKEYRKRPHLKSRVRSSSSGPG
eukprot:2861418-Rhodomonas_salina.1